MSSIVIFGAGDIARLAHYYFTHDSEYEVAGFCVDKAYRKSSKFCNLPVVDFEIVNKRYPPQKYNMFVAISYDQMNQVRANKYAAAKKSGYVLVNYISSHATFLTDYPIGDNCFILENNTIQPFVRIGSNVTLWSGNHIGHDSVISDNCFISSHVVVSGHCHIGQSSFIGVNATLRNGIKIAPSTLIGAGAAIMRDTVENGVYVSRPASKLSNNSNSIDL